MTLSKITLLTNAHFEQVKHFDVSKKWSSDTWVPLNANTSMYFDHQCRLVRVYFYFLHNISQHLLYGFKHIHVTYDAIVANIATLKPG